jgi:hypothetical protein
MEWFTDLGLSTSRPQYCKLDEDAYGVWNVILPIAMQIMTWSGKFRSSATSTVGFAGRHPNKPWLNYMAIGDRSEVWKVAHELGHVLGQYSIQAEGSM